MTRKSLLLALALGLLLVGGGATVWFAFRSREESPELLQTPAAQAERISGTILRSRLEELERSALFLELQMKGEELLAELEAR